MLNNVLNPNNEIIFSNSNSVIKKKNYKHGTFHDKQMQNVFSYFWPVNDFSGRFNYNHQYYFQLIKFSPGTFFRNSFNCTLSEYFPPRFTHYIMKVINPR